MATDIDIAGSSLLRSRTSWVGEKATDCVDLGAEHLVDEGYFRGTSFTFGREGKSSPLEVCAGTAEALIPTVDERVTSLSRVEVVISLVNGLLVECVSWAVTTPGGVKGWRMAGVERVVMLLTVEEVVGDLVGFAVEDRGAKSGVGLMAGDQNNITHDILIMGC